MGSLLYAILLGPFVLAAPAPSVTIEELIEKTRRESETALAAGKDLEAIQMEIRARDIVLGAKLESELASIKNQDDILGDAVSSNRRVRQKFLKASVEKPFSTGTTLKTSLGHDSSLFDTSGERDTSNWEVRITQSLWRDFFGRGTTLRRQAEEAELASRRAEALYRLQTFLVDVETLYWDLAVAVKEEEIREQNIENGRRLETWTRQRLARSAAEQSDFLQAQALVSQGTLDLIDAKNQIELSKTKFRQHFPNALGDFKPSDSSLNSHRALESLIASNGGALGVPQRLDAMSAAYLARQAEIETKKVRDSLKPKFDVYAAYGQNGIADGFGDSWDRTNSGDYYGSRVGVLVSVDLNRSLVGDREKAARLAAEARALEAQALLRGSKVGWVDLVRQVNLLKERAKEAIKLADIQRRKVAYERKRFRLGRSTTFQIVTYELDAANSEINKYRALTDLRKAEAQARLFIANPGAG